MRASLRSQVLMLPLRRRMILGALTMKCLPTCLVETTICDLSIQSLGGFSHFGAVAHV